MSAGSSERQRLADGTVDLVLTDPPYFDDVQYGELAALFLTWSRAVGLLPSSVEVDLRSEAVVNSVRGTDLAGYRKLLTAIFRECRRTLKDDGRILLTFHNKDVRAWWALARALRSANLHVRTLAVSASENDADHFKRGRLGFTKDLVIECGIGAQTLQPTTASPGIDSQTRELLVAGRFWRLAARTRLTHFGSVFRRYAVRSARNGSPPCRRCVGGSGWCLSRRCPSTRAPTGSSPPSGAILDEHPGVPDNVEQPPDLVDVDLSERHARFDVLAQTRRSEVRGAEVAQRPQTSLPWNCENGLGGT